MWSWFLQISMLRASFYPICLLDCNNLHPEVKEWRTICIFKNKLLSTSCPPPKPVYSIHDSKGFAILTHLHIGLKSHYPKSTKIQTQLWRHIESTVPLKRRYRDHGTYFAPLPFSSLVLICREESGITLSVDDDRRWSPDLLVLFYISIKN